MDRTTGPQWYKHAPPPGSPTSWLKTNTGPMFAKDREEAARGTRPRFEWVYDQAVPATHDRLNGVMRTQLDAWHCPKTSGKQHVLRATSHIVDTDLRQKVARHYNKALLSQSGLQDAFDPLAGKPIGGGVRFRPDGSLELANVRRCNSSPDLSRTHDEGQWLPSWVDRSHWRKAVSPQAPKWSGVPFAAMGPSLWAGATMPPRAGSRPLSTRSGV
eukprot:TRINITY_DN51473_c0_g1_i1.p1 TRINITY_DN51473_c0_g1~~TRINITY_DN51473_c0_g1_i1.p1  ORF type:complete len:237 (-),score=25.41 TRINITY_DN51473_c0_g1_i1:34-678(-)